MKVDPQVGERQKAKLSSLKQKRDPQQVKEALHSIRMACEGTDNVMPHIVNAVRVYATLGEICGVMREVFGEYQQSFNL